MKEIIKTDERGNLIYIRHSDGSKEWFEYDEQNREIYKKYHTGVECRTVYDDKNRTVHSIYTNGDEFFVHKNEVGNKIYRMDIEDGVVEKEWWVYDESGTILRYYYNNKGDKSWYDELGKLVHIIHRGNETWYEYDESSFKSYCKYRNGTEEWVTHTPNLHYSKKVKKIKEYTGFVGLWECQIIETQCIEKWDEFDDYRNLICEKMNKYTEKKIKRK